MVENTGTPVGLDARASSLLMAAGVTTSVELTQALLDRIDEVDRREGGVRAVLEVNPDALSDARRLDAERAAGELRGPLHGVAVLVKDNIDTATPLHTTAGSLALAGTSPSSDAPLVRRLRDAGLVVLGKANLSEWANYRSTGSTSGWSAVGGLTRNPWQSDRSAGGSSSGSAAAIAAGLAPLSVGTETDGSIVCPAAFCGVVGVKPTVGLVPTHGVIPVSHSQDTVGPMARTVRDAAALLAVLSGQHPSALLPGGTTPDLRGVRLGLPRAQLWTDDAGVAGAVEAAIAVLVAAGAVVIDDVELPGAVTIDPLDEVTVLDHELKVGLATYLATRPSGGPRTLADVIAFNRENADRELVHFDQDTFVRAELTTGLDAAVYVAARRRCVEASRTQGIDRVLLEHRLDALVMPSMGPAWRIDLEHGDGGPDDAGAYEVGCTTLPAMAGYPLVTVPCGLVGGLPVGITFSAAAGSEAMLLRVADAYEVGAYGPAGSTAALGDPFGVTR